VIRIAYANEDSVFGSEFEAHFETARGAKLFMDKLEEEGIEYKLADNKTVASGIVVVRDLDTGQEWEEIVEVFEEDIEEDGLTVEDVARQVAMAQAEPADVETLEVDLS